MDRLEAVGVNAPQIEYWNGPVGEPMGWSRRHAGYYFGGTRFHRDGRL